MSPLKILRGPQTRSWSLPVSLLCGSPHPQGIHPTRGPEGPPAPLPASPSPPPGSVVMMHTFQPLSASPGVDARAASCRVLASPARVPAASAGRGREGARSKAASGCPSCLSKAKASECQHLFVTRGPQRQTPLEPQSLCPFLRPHVGPRTAAPPARGNLPPSLAPGRPRDSWACGTPADKLLPGEGPTQAAVGPREGGEEARGLVCATARPSAKPAPGRAPGAPTSLHRPNQQTRGYGYFELKAREFHVSHSVPGHRRPPSSLASSPPHPDGCAPTPGS